MYKQSERLWLNLRSIQLNERPFPELFAFVRLGGDSFETLKPTNVYHKLTNIYIKI